MFFLDATDVVRQPEFSLKQSVSLASFTSYRVGGVADWLALPKTPDEIADSLSWAQANELPVTFLGAGSNLLVSDRGVQGLVICTRHLRGVTFDDDAGAAAVAVPLVNLCPT